MDRNYFNLLLDYYGELLTDHQFNVLSSYYKDDLSMNEIAEEYNISKAAVSDLIKRSLSQLEEYERKLSLVKQAEKIDNLMVKMSLEKDAKIDKYVEELKKIVRD